MAEPCYLWREVGTGRRVCLLNHDHGRAVVVARRPARPMASRPSRRRLPWGPIARATATAVKGGALAVTVYAGAVLWLAAAAGR